MTSDWKVIVTSWHESAEQLDKLSRAAKTKDLAKEIAAQGALSTAQENRAVVAQRNGFTECSRF